MADEKRIRLLYLGVRPGQKKPRVHLWWSVDGLVNDGTALSKAPGNHEPEREHVYARSKKRNNNIVQHVRPGNIYSFAVNETGSILVGTSKYEEDWLCDEDVVKWAAEHRAYDLAIESQAKIKKEAGKRPDLEVLEPFRMAYRNLNSRQGAMLIGEIVAYITRHGL